MDYHAAIRREADRFYAIADAADPLAMVPSCPDWSVADLVYHLGDVHWFWGSDIELQATSPDDIDAAKPPRPDVPYAELIQWARVQTDRMISLLEANPDDVRVWTWGRADSDQTVGFIRRHQVQEGAVHRWDLEGAVGAPAPIDADVAADSIDEFFAVTVPWCVREDKPLPGSVHVHCTDVDGEWFLHADGTVEAIHAKGDVALRGSASDVLLALYKRVSIDTLEVIGDAALARRFTEAVSTE